ncbi:class I SAM-dependent methyltransferase [Catenuloplanes sp. NPDC051500]|uniref:class I SAM-dependent methyltransferase n=1 Tax=Catenuloplanes sp. NPDC051500 TaxID=3363959 RepID=UPI0037B036C3
MAFDFAAAYSDLNPDDGDYRFYAGLAAEMQATRILDLGCGTGTLTRPLASQGCSAVGVDPDPEMLRVARQKSNGEEVDWRLGFSDRADTASADFAVMSGHVAQVFRHDSAWNAVLHDLHRALSPNGTLAFESRNPAARAWEQWSRQATLRTLDTEEGRIDFWHKTVWVSLPLVAYDTPATSTPMTRKSIATSSPSATRPHSCAHWKQRDLPSLTNTATGTEHR